MRDLGARGAFARWPAAAVALVDAAAARHGGWARWAAVSTVTLEFAALDGMLPRQKGIGHTFPPPRRVSVVPHACRVVFHDWAGGEGVFDRGDVRIERSDGVIEASPDHRRTFAGWRKYRRWSPLDALYFFGYALANYTAQPFLLSHARFVDATAESVRVEFDADWPAHCRRQRFWFADGLQVRHDYVAEVVGRWARAAHYTSDYVEVDGLWLPRTRHVVGRIGRWVTPLTVLTARFGAMTVS